MNFFIFLTFIILLLYNRISFVVCKNEQEKCPFEQTVNLTNHQHFDNGSYFYQGILIPPQRQHRYKYYLEFSGNKIKVSSHMRGCVCDKKPCIKLCCAKEEFFNETTNQCEKITIHMKVSKNLSLRLHSGTDEIRDIFEHFTYQIGFPCNEPKAMHEEDQALLFENGTLYAQEDESLLSTRDYCYSPRFDNKTEYILHPFSCPMSTDVPWPLLLNTYAMALSVLFLILTIVVYLILKELRRNLSGKLLICYFLSLTIGYAIIVFINISKLRFEFWSCSLLGFTCYFFLMAAYFWLSVLCFDIWINFQQINFEINSRRNFKYFIIYSLYAWGIAGLATVLLIFIEASPDVDDIYKPGIGRSMCWLNTNKWSALIYFYGPELIILLFNCATFIHLTLNVYTVKRDVARITQKQRFFKENGIVILRLFLIMGISWLFDILSYCLREYKKWDFLFYFSDFANAIQGISIFSLLVFKPKVLNLLKERFWNTKPDKPSRSTSTVTTSFSKLEASMPKEDSKL